MSFDTNAVRTIINQINCRKHLRQKYNYDEEDLKEIKRQKCLSVSDLLKEINETIKNGNVFDLVSGLYVELDSCFFDFFCRHECYVESYVALYRSNYPNWSHQMRLYSEEDGKLLLSVMTPEIIKKYMKIFIDNIYRSTGLSSFFGTRENYWHYNIHSLYKKLGGSFISQLIIEEEKYKKEINSYIYKDSILVIIKPLLYLYSEEHLPSVLWNLVIDYFYDLVF